MEDQRIGRLAEDDQNRKFILQSKKDIMNQSRRSIRSAASRAASSNHAMHTSQLYDDDHNNNNVNDHDNECTNVESLSMHQSDYDQLALQRQSYIVYRGAYSETDQLRVASARFVEVVTPRVQTASNENEPSSAFSSYDNSPEISRVNTNTTYLSVDSPITNIQQSSSIGRNESNIIYANTSTNIQRKLQPTSLLASFLVQNLSEATTRIRPVSPFPKQYTSIMPPTNAPTVVQPYYDPHALPPYFNPSMDFSDDEPDPVFIVAPINTTPSPTPITHRRPDSKSGKPRLFTSRPGTASRSEKSITSQSTITATVTSSPSFYTNRSQHISDGVQPLSIDESTKQVKRRQSVSQKGTPTSKWQIHTSKVDPPKFITSTLRNVGGENSSIDTSKSQINNNNSSSPSTLSVTKATLQSTPTTKLIKQELSNVTITSTTTSIPFNDDTITPSSLPVSATLFRPLQSIEKLDKTLSQLQSFMHKEATSSLPVLSRKKKKYTSPNPTQPHLPITSPSKTGSTRSQSENTISSTDTTSSAVTEAEKKLLHSLEALDCRLQDNFRRLGLPPRTLR